MVSRRGFALVATAVIAVAVAGFGISTSKGVFRSGVRTVVPGELYRSGQPSIARLDRTITEQHIASVLSLRKWDPPAPEVVAEHEHLQQLGIVHDNVPMRTMRMPRPDDLAHLLERYDAGPYPMLVHCEEGADRTGLAVVIWLVVYKGMSVADARAREFSWHSGHFSFGQTRALDEFLDLYEQTANGLDLRTWIRDRYPRLFDADVVGPASNTVLAHGRG